MNKKGQNILNIGTSSLLVIFIVLCLVTFATLSVVSAHADYKLSQTLDDRTKNYYLASNQAENTLNTIDNRLLFIYHNSSSELDYFNKCQAQLKQTGDEFNYNPVNRSISYTQVISSNLVLTVSLDVIYPNSENNRFYKLTSWQESNTASWQPDNSLNLMQID
ncbi:MAG: hypothetical protein HY818_09245 [Acetobacterium woodii]|nr:hypothetical protein [Acetobacterium woodii]